MNTNAIADEILIYLNEKHDRVYRNKAPQVPIFPYVVFTVESVVNSYPSEDLYLNINIFEEINKSARDIDDLGDLIDKGLNHSVINNDKLNLQFEREQRQYINGTELITTQLINIRYVVRAYLKEEIGGI